MANAQYSPPSTSQLFTTDEEKVWNTLKDFTVYFVQEFEKKMGRNIDFALGNETKKGKTVEYMAAPLKPLGFSGKIAASFLEMVDNYIRKKKAKNISQNLLTRRGVIVNAAVSVFISYEWQFMKICNNHVNPVVPLKTIAADAVERFFNDFEKGTKALNEYLSSEAIAKGVIYGESKKLVPLQPYFKEKNVDNISVAEFFENVKLVTSNSNKKPNNHYEKQNESNFFKNGLEQIIGGKKGKKRSNGFRRLFGWELNISEKSDFENYKKLEDKASIENNYVYRLKLESLEKYSQDVLTEINKRDPDLVLPNICETMTKILENSAKGNESCKMKIWYDVKAPVFLFIGRKGELEEIAENITTKIVVVHGLPGVGKSELAFKFAKVQYDCVNDSVVWINATTSDTTFQSFYGLHNCLGCKKVDENENKELALKLIMQNIYETLDGEKILFIFDNAEKFEEIKNFLPSERNKIHVLICSTNKSEWRKSRGSWELISLTNFNNNEAEHLIVKQLNLKEEDSDAFDLAKLLCNFPLALIQAVSYIKKREERLRIFHQVYTIKDYIEDFKSKEKEILSNEEFKKMNDYDKSTYTALKMCLGNITAEKSGKLAKKILDMLSYLASDHIPPAILSEIESDKAELGGGVALLEDYSIVKYRKEYWDWKNSQKKEVCLNIHGLIQRVNRLELKEIGKEEEVLENIQRSLNKYVDVYNFDIMLPHVVSVWNYSSTYDTMVQKFIENTKTAEIDNIPLIHLICRGNNYEIIKNILEKIEPAKLKEIINMSDNLINSRKLVHYVPENGDLKLLQLLIKKGIPVENGKICECKARDNSTPLHLVANSGNLKMVEALTEIIKIDDKALSNRTALHCAAEICSSEIRNHGFSDIISVLLNEGANVNAVDKEITSD